MDERCAHDAARCSASHHEWPTLSVCPRPDYGPQFIYKDNKAAYVDSKYILRPVPATPCLGTRYRSSNREPRSRPDPPLRPPSQADDDLPAAVAQLKDKPLFEMPLVHSGI